MPLADKPPAQITEHDLLGLIGIEPEGKLLDYKRDVVGPSDADKREFLFNASSFANTQGGYLVFGMDESKGLPANLVGLPGIDPDKEILRLEQMLRDGIRPPLSVETAPVRLASGSTAIVMRIAKSWCPPHQVTFQKAFRFYARDTNGKYQIDVDELRSIFSLSASVAQKMRNFRVERSAKILQNDTPVPLFKGGVLALLVVPLSAFNLASTFPLHQAARDPNRFPTLVDPHTLRHQITFDGLTVTSNVDAPPKPQRAYTHVFQTGAVEAVASPLAPTWLILHNLEALIIHYTKVYMQALHSFGVEPPFAVMASLLNAKDLRLVVQQSGFPEGMTLATISNQQLHFVESIFHQVPADDKIAARNLRITLDHVANAAGLPSSPYFDVDGNYTLKF